MIIFKRNFKVEDIEYRLSINNTFNIYLEVIGGKTRGGKRPFPVDMFGEEIGTTHAIGISPKPFTVFREIEKYVLEFISIKHPPFFIINSYYNVQRAKVYKKILEKFLRKSTGYLNDYRIAYSDTSGVEGYILIVRENLLRL
jgi:hypothetical protein